MRAIPSLKPARLLTPSSCAAVALALASLVGACDGSSRTPPPDDNTPTPPAGAATCDVNGSEAPLPDASAARVDGAPVDTSCIGNPRQVGASVDATLEGCIEIFGVGNSAKRGLTVEIFARDADPSTGTPIAAGTVAVRTDASTLDCANADADAPACRALACESQGFYRTSTTIPTHEPLIMKISAGDDDTVIDTYLYDLYFFSDNVVDGRLTYEASLIYRSTYDSIPTLAGRQIEGGTVIGDGTGRGVIAGEVHDCADVVVENATVTDGAKDSKTSFAFFNGSDDPKPDPRRTSTASDGLYAVLNASTEAGNNTHTLAAGMREPGCTGDDCQCVSLGTRTIQTFPDSVSIVTFRGDIPVVAP